MKLLKRFLAPLFLSLMVSNTALAAGGTTAEAEAMVDKALAYIKVHGAQKGFEEFNRPGSEFFDRDLYIFAYDFSGVNLALGANPKMTGKNLLNMKSADGKFYLQEMIEVTKTKGSGWVDYSWTNPETKKIQPKTSIVKRIPGFDGFVGCGIYK